MNHENSCRIIRRLEKKLNHAYDTRRGDLPYTTLTFAQSLDGSITTMPGAMMSLSNIHSLMMTHHLRARHDAILVGINTVLVDDPRLTVRLVEGPSPRPVVVDSHLRLPLTARLLQANGRPPLVATTEAACLSKEQQLRAAGADVVRFPANEYGQVDLKSLLAHLQRAGIRSLMVEGGARIITSFLSARLADQLILTVAPVFVGGLRAVNAPAQNGAWSLPPLINLHHDRLDDDLIVTADLVREGLEFAAVVPRACVPALQAG